MDGFRINSILAGFILVSQTPVFASSQNDMQECFNTCKALSASQLFEKFKQFNTAANISLSCPWKEGQASPENTLDSGAKKVLQVSTRSCSVQDKIDVKSEDFLYLVMSAQGYKLSPEQKSLKPKDFYPSKLYQTLGAPNDNKDQSPFGCFTKVSSDAPFLPGDLLVSKSDVVILDQVNLKVSELKVADPRNSQNCRDAISVALKSGSTKIIPTVYSAHGRTPFFPLYGASTSPWLTAITERAVAECAQNHEAPSKVTPGVFVLRRRPESSTQGACSFAPDSQVAECAKRCCGDSP